MRRLHLCSLDLVDDGGQPGRVEYFPDADSGPADNEIAAAILASAVGDISGFARPDKLASYLGLNPKVRQSGEIPPTWDASRKPAAPTPEA
jgi:hypothetical protein